jgi:hypothetical protein
MLESMQDLLSQQQQMGRTTEQTQMDSQPAVFKKPSRPPRRLNKKDISSPCNFKHVSGISKGCLYRYSKFLFSQCQRYHDAADVELRAGVARNHSEEDEVAVSL